LFDSSVSETACVLSTNAWTGLPTNCSVAETAPLTDVVAPAASPATDAVARIASAEASNVSLPLRSSKNVTANAPVAAALVGDLGRDGAGGGEALAVRGQAGRDRDGEQVGAPGRRRRVHNTALPERADARDGPDLVRAQRAAEHGHLVELAREPVVVPSSRFAGR
jgi:hypothetical protein